tara:strand:- start:230 stop:502 length:273 start_codon:yes stop_codon:yes gene_type:complete
MRRDKYKLEINNDFCPDEEDNEIPYRTIEEAEKKCKEIRKQFENESLFKRCIKSSITRDGGMLWHTGVGLAQEWINLQFYINLATKLKVI